MLGKPNPEIFSELMTAATCGSNSETLTTSNEDSLNTKVVDLFEFYSLESEFALFGLWMKELWSNYNKLQNMGSPISGKTKMTTSSTSKEVYGRPRLF